MYQVVELYGHFEPWWFLDDWKDDIIRQEEFSDFNQALTAFRARWLHLRVSTPYYRSQASLLTAFWDDRDISYCEECEDPIQNYQSLALLKDWEELPAIYHQPFYDCRNDKAIPPMVCTLKKIG